MRFLNLNIYCPDHYIQQIRLNMMRICAISTFSIACGRHNNKCRVCMTWGFFLNSVFEKKTKTCRAYGRYQLPEQLILQKNNKKQPAPHLIIPFAEDSNLLTLLVLRTKGWAITMAISCLLLPWSRASPGQNSHVIDCEKGNILVFPENETQQPVTLPCEEIVNKRKCISCLEQKFSR